MDARKLSSLVIMLTLITVLGMVLVSQWGILDADGVSSEKILFHKTIGGQTDMYEIGVDGTGISPLGPPDPGQHVQAAWSDPFGPIVFRSIRSGVYDIFIRRTDGSEVNLTDTPTFPNSSENPDLSWDGQWIAFSHGDLGNTNEIWVMDIDGENPRQLTDNNANESAPAWCGNRKIAFPSLKDGNWNIYIIDPSEPATGSIPEEEWIQVPTSAAHETMVACSRNSDLIAYESAEPGNAEMFVRTADMTVDPIVFGPKKQLTFDPGPDSTPSISPDSKKVAFTCKVAVTKNDVCMYDMEIDQLTNLTVLETGDSHTPDWSAPANEPDEDDQDDDDEEVDQDEDQDDDEEDDQDDEVENDG